MKNLSKIKKKINEWKIFRLIFIEKKIQYTSETTKKKSGNFPKANFMKKIRKFFYPKVFIKKIIFYQKNLFHCDSTKTSPKGPMTYVISN